MYFQLIWWRDVTNDVVTVDANLSQLLNQPFRLVQAAMENNLSNHIGKSYNLRKRESRYLRNSAIRTQTKVVAAGSLNWALTCEIRIRRRN